jgi:hypothetical protein
MSFHTKVQYPMGACNSSKSAMAGRIYVGADGTPTFEKAMKSGTMTAGLAGEDGGTFVANPEPPQN